LFGSEDAPVANVSFSGIAFTGGRPTMFDPHGQVRARARARSLSRARVGFALRPTHPARCNHHHTPPHTHTKKSSPQPSGGDWALERMAYGPHRLAAQDHLLHETGAVGLAQVFQLGQSAKARD